jgi:hypothetical protein
MGEGKTGARNMLNGNGSLRQLEISEIRAETEANHQAFRVLIDGPGSPIAPGQYALMRDRQLVDVFASRRDALEEARHLFSDHRYSVHCDRRRPKPADEVMPSSMPILNRSHN